MSSTANIAYAAVASQQAQTSQILQTTFTKQAAEADQAVAALLQQSAANLEAIQAAPPPGTGLVVDKTA
ncbi:MAG: hypothetical protein AAGL24_15645 [Pseudomonadota bacterium]